MSLANNGQPARSMGNFAVRLQRVKTPIKIKSLYFFSAAFSKPCGSRQIALFCRASGGNLLQGA
jgi:hypothetical protein